jgi:putative transcriptional regulator
MQSAFRRSALLRTCCAPGAWCIPTSAIGQTVGVLPGSSPTKGRLLVATPPLDDPNFDRTVIFVLEHHDEGALGVVINRPTEEELGEPLDRWEDLQATPAQVFAGGPVETDALIALALANSPLNEASEDLSPVVGRVASADLTADPAFVAARVSAVRVFRGYAGWGPGQLEGEIMAGAWLVFDAEPDDVFAPQPGQLWRTVLRRQGGRLGWLANAPDDLSAN